MFPLPPFPTNASSQNQVMCFVFSPEMPFKLQSYAVTPDKEKGGQKGEAETPPRILGPWMFKIQLSGRLAGMFQFLTEHTSLWFLLFWLQAPAWMTAGSTLETWPPHPPKMSKFSCTLPTPSVETSSLWFTSNGSCRRTVSGRVSRSHGILPTSRWTPRRDHSFSPQTQNWVPSPVLKHEGPNFVLKGSIHALNTVSVF